MSDRRSSAELGPSLEAALAGFPFPERDWEKDAAAVEARLSQSQLGSTDAALLEAPLPSEPDESTLAPSATATPLTHSGVRSQSLAEMARRSVENKQAAERAMARESLALAAQQRPNAEDALLLREALASKAVAAPAAPSSARVTQAVAAAPAPSRALATTSSVSAWPKLGAAAAVIALAAGVLFWLRQPTAPIPLVTAKAAPGLAAAPTSEAKPSAVNAGAAEPALALQLPPSGVDPNSLPGESPNKAAEAAHEKPALAAGHAAAGVPSAAASSAEKIVLEDEPASPPATAAAAAVEKPVEKPLPPDPALRPADSTSGALPAKPSTGAVQAALGAVMSGARRCVAGDDAPSSAVVVFGSDGHVQSVSVTGPASGQSSGACIQAQLGRARVQPFAAASFSVSATVRPE
ncbi:MAG TPA: hypothetical protein VGL19_12605 [Polyangiaceae bacterium]